MENKNKKIIIIVSIIVLLLVLIGASYFIYQMIYIGDEKEQESNIENYKYALEVKLNEEGYICSNDEACITYTIATESENAKYLANAGYKNQEVFILYDDNGLKLYDLNGKNKIQKLNLKNDYDGNYSLITSEKDDEVIGIVYRNNNNYSIEKYYSLNKQQFISDNIITADMGYGFLYDNNGLYSYNMYKDESEKINLETTYDTYKISYVNDTLFGIYYSNDNENGYYNKLTDKKMYKNMYVEIEAVNENYLRAYKTRRLGECNGWSSYDYLLSAQEEKVIFDEKVKNGVCNSYYAAGGKDKEFLIVSKGFQAYPTFDIYTKEKELIKKDVEHYNVLFDNGNMYVIENNILNKYDNTGKLLNSNKDYNNLLGFLDEDLVYLKDNYISLKNILDNGKEIKVTEWNNNYKYEGNYSYIDENTNQKCLAISFKEPITKDGKNYLTMESCYNTITKEVINNYSTNMIFANQILD